MKNKFFDYLKLMRVKHYLKNFLIFLPLVFSGNLFNCNYLFKSFIGFVIFSLTCSIIYVINDIRDVDKDKKHDKKKNRPIASGRVSIRNALLLAFILLIISILLLILFRLPVYSIILLIIYFVINLAYSFGFKNIPLLDIIILTSGFVIRVLFGASITNIVVSNWLYLTVMSMSFYLSLGKRRGEIKTKKSTREVLKYYTNEFLDKCMYMCLGIAIVFYSLWTVDESVINRVGKDLVWTVPIIIIICMRYSMLIENENNDGDPVEVVFGDKAIIILGLVYVMFLLGLIYW